MTIRARVRCINKTDRYNPHERILNIGGVNSDGGSWKLSVEKAIVGMEESPPKYSFYVSEGGETVEVIIATHNGRKYLKTEADGLQPDNLLSLDECP